MRTVAALYIDPRGPYPKLPGVDCWDEARDANGFDGFEPVVAHPPCGPWGKLAHMCKRIDQAQCAIEAVGFVRANGGVLEHPEHSRLWPALGLPAPGHSDEFGGRTIAVAQCEWGHPARKRTWLYLVRVPETPVAPPFPGREPTHWISGGRGRAGKKRLTTPVPPGIKVCSAQQRRRTPPLFEQWLVSLARLVK